MPKTTNIFRLLSGIIRGLLEKAASVSPVSAACVTVPPTLRASRACHHVLLIFGKL